MTTYQTQVKIKEITSNKPLTFEGAVMCIDPASKEETSAIILKLNEDNKIEVVSSHPFFDPNQFEISAGDFLTGTQMFKYLKKAKTETYKVAEAFKKQEETK